MKKYILALSLLFLLNCATTLHEMEAAILESKTCEKNEDCMLAGFSDCTCGSPVNKASEGKLKELALNINCGGIQIECATQINIRCEEKRCKADIQK